MAFPTHRAADLPILFRNRNAETGNSERIRLRLPFSAACRRFRGGATSSPATAHLVGMLPARLVPVPPGWRGCSLRRCSFRRNCSFQPDLMLAPVVVADLILAPVVVNRGRCCGLMFRLVRFRFRSQRDNGQTSCDRHSEHEPRFLHARKNTLNLIRRRATRSAAQQFLNARFNFLSQFHVNRSRRSSRFFRLTARPPKVFGIVVGMLHDRPRISSWCGPVRSENVSVRFVMISRAEAARAILSGLCVDNGKCASCMQ